MSRLTFIAEELNGIARSSQLISLNFPFSKGALQSTDSVFAQSALKTKHICQFVPLAYWPDKSIKWATLYFTADIAAFCKLQFQLIIGADQEDGTVERKQKSAENRNVVMPPLHLNEISLFDQKGRALELTIESSNELPAIYVDDQVIQQRQSILRISSNPLIKVMVFQRYIFTDVKDPSSFCVKTELTIHNTKRAEHPDGKWDLGDPNAFYFEQFGICYPEQAEQFVIRDLCSESGASQWQAEKAISVVQTASGGEFWQSPVHVNAEGKIPLAHNGYQLAFDDNLHKGVRISPLVSANGASGESHYFIENFWQNFPTGITSFEEQIQLLVFPKADYAHELQPGEKKTHVVWSSRNTSSQSFEGLIMPLGIQISEAVISASNTVPFFASESEPGYTALMSKVLDPNEGFTAKQERIDEFGWRNFGDLYADHENAEFKGSGDIVSHYNNQYDPIQGLLRRYLKTGESSYFELAHNLASHVNDIDIYDTELDRSEYNYGLFWHTDHYVDAATATHRTYSKNQPQNVYNDHAGGGGPGGQHCYTTGLMMHYMLTGDQRSKDSVLKLTKWITNVYEGSGGLLDFLVAYKNRYRADLKNVLTGQYPLDRGTGHYIFALLDCYELTSQQSWLDKASLVIRHTFHPNEDIAARGLDNVEETWFYTVFLQAVCRYLWAKENASQFDESYDYAVQVLVKFAEWMAENEQPYLLKPEILEFPNSTWTAQDMRKVNVLCAAASYVEGGARFQQKAEEIYQYILEQLASDENNDFCRIQCLLMQNEGWREYFKNGNRVWRNMVEWDKQPTQSRPSFVPILVSRITDFSLIRELKWLAGRSEKIHQMVNKS